MDICKYIEDPMENNISGFFEDGYKTAYERIIDESKDEIGMEYY